MSRLHPGIGVLLLAALFGTFPVAAGAQDPPAPTATAPVSLDGRELFRLRGSSALPAAERADAVAARIAGIAADGQVSADSLLITPHELGLAISVQGRHLVVLAEADALAEGFSVRELAATFRYRIREAILGYRSDREPGRMLKNGILLAGATVLLAAALVLIVRGTRRLDRLFAARYRPGAGPERAGSFRFVGADRIWWLLRLASGALRALAVLVLAYLYLQWALGLFPWTRSFGRGLLDLVSEPVRVLLHGFVGYLPEAVFLVVLFVVARWSIRAARAFLEAVERGTITLPDFDAEWAMPTYRIVRAVLIAGFIVIAYPYIPGSDSGAFKGVSLLIGLLVSFGSSSVVANVVAGYTMIYRRAFRVGDRVLIKEFTGDVVAVRPLVTILRTPKNEEIVIPNADVLNTPVVNYSAMARSGALILHTSVGIGYEVPWRQVEAMLLLAAERTDGLNRERPAFVLQTNLGDFCTTYELNVYCRDAQRMGPLYANLHRSILDVFNEYGVQIMTPAYEGDPEKPKVVPKEQWHAAPARPEG